MQIHQFIEKVKIISVYATNIVFSTNVYISCFFFCKNKQTAYVRTLSFDLFQNSENESFDWLKKFRK